MLPAGIQVFFFFKRERRELWPPIRSLMHDEAGKEREDKKATPGTSGLQTSLDAAQRCVITA